MQQPAYAAWNVIDFLFVRDAVIAPEIDGGIESVRQSVSSVYDSGYRTTRELYGETSDDDGLGVNDEDEERVDSPFQQFNPRRDQQPTSLSPLTPHDESGFHGLDAPLG